MSETLSEPKWPITPDRRWVNCGAREGLYVPVKSEHGEIRVAFPEDADQLADILNLLEERAEFGLQCYQDRCENAYVEASVVKVLRRELDTLRAAVARLEGELESGDQEHAAEIEAHQITLLKLQAVEGEREALRAAINGIRDCDWCDSPGCRACEVLDAALGSTPVADAEPTHGTSTFNHTETSDE